MMHKKPTSDWMRLAYVALLPLLAGTMFLCNPARAEIRPATTETPVVTETPAVVETPTVQNPPVEDKTVPFAQVEDKPTFQGGDAVSFSKWVSSQLVYPAEEKEAGHQGRVMVQFAVNTDGSVSDVKILRSTGYEALDNEALRVISSSPAWNPGKINGEAVRVTYQFPVIFQVRGDKDDPKPAGQTISIRTASGAMPLIILDGVKYIGELSAIDPSTIEKMEVLKDEETIKKYGDEAKNGVILITSKKQ